MQNSNISIEKALDDLSAVRNSLERLEIRKRTGKKPIHSSWLLLQAGALISAATVLLIDLCYYSQTNFLLSSVSNSTVRIAGLVGMGFLLCILCIATYAVLWRSAKQAGELLNEHIARYFVQLSVLSFCSDLLIKYVTLCVIILALRPEWVAPLLFLFTADYLLQGRLFCLPVKLSIFLAGICLITGGLQAYYGSPSLTYPLIAFTAICSGSLLLNYRKSCSVGVARGNE